MSNNTPIACHEFSTELWLLISGEMPQARQQLWQHHLQACPHCQEILATAQAVQAQYMRLPLYGAPERLVRSLATQAKLQKENVPWRERINRWFSTLSWHYHFRPRRVLVGVALAVFLLAFFHRLAFRPEIQHTWEATAFDRKVGELWITLGEYDADLSHDERHWGDLTEISTFDEQASNLRKSLSMLSSELSRTKL